MIAGMLSSAATAAPVLCQNIADNHMILDSSEVSACLDAGIGNISGNPGNDPFLLGVGAGFTLASKDDAANPFNIMTTQNGSMGTWSFDPSYWLANTGGALGFKFGTGNQPDEWFVFQLVQGVSSGSWDFVNVHGGGGGLSHTNLYTDGSGVPEPTTLSILGLALGLIGLSRRRRQ